MIAGKQQAIRTTPGKHQLHPRTERALGAAGLLGAALLPLALWHRAIFLIASDFRLEPSYLVTGWTAYALIALGLAFLVPAVVSIGRSPHSRLYPRSRNAYVAWGITLYVLGLGLAVQVAQITHSLNS